MKTLKNLILFTCLSLLISCGDNTDEDLGISGEGSLSANVAGTSFTSLKTTVSAVITNGVAAIQGSNSNGDYIRINISSYAGVGTYNTGDVISNTNSIAYGSVSPFAAWTSTFDIGTGTIEITEDTATTVSGTFSFTGFNGATDNKAVTEGKFNATKN
jgi:hypothetical protein